MSIFGEDPEIADSHRVILQILCGIQSDETTTLDQIAGEYCGIDPADLPPANKFFAEGTPEYALRRSLRIARKRVTEDLQWLKTEGWAECESVGAPQPKRWRATPKGRRTFAAYRPAPCLHRPRKRTNLPKTVRFGNAGSKASEVREKVLGLLVDGGDEDDYTTWRLIELGWSLRNGDRGHYSIYQLVSSALRWLKVAGLADSKKLHPSDMAKHWVATEVGVQLIRDSD